VRLRFHENTRESPKTDKLLCVKDVDCIAKMR